MKKKQALLNIELIASSFIRSKTNDGEYCKQIFEVIKADVGNKDLVLGITKLILTDKPESFILYEKYGYQNIKQFKTQRLYNKCLVLK